MTPFSNSGVARLLRQVARVVCAHPRWFVYPQVGLALAGALSTALWLKLDMNRSHLVGTNPRQQSIFLKHRTEFRKQEELVVVVQSGRREHNRQFVERLAARVSAQTNLFTDLFYKSDLATFGPKALLLVPVKELEDMRRVLHECRPLIQEFAQAANFDSLFRLVNKQFRTAAAAVPGTTESLVQRIPYLQRLIEQARQSLMRPGMPPSPGVETLFAGGQRTEQSSYFAFEEGRVYLMTLEPKSEALMPNAIEELRRLIGATQAEVPGVNVGLTGEPVLEYDEMREARHDSVVASVVAIFLASMIFIIAYRQAWRPLKAALCLLLGLGYSLGFTTLAVGHLNILTITFAPMLIGLAMDFGIHFITRYEEEMRNRRTETEAIERATGFTGQGIIAGSVTMAAAFLAMALTDFRGIQEMGIISGCGVLLCVIPMMTCLPLLLRCGPQNKLDHKTGPTHQRRLEIELLWLKHPVLVLLATLLLCAGAVSQFPGVRFDYDLLHLQSQGLPSVVYEKTLIEATGIEATGSSTLHSEVIADSAAEAQVYAQRLKRLPAVALVRSAAGYITPDQDRKLELIRAIKSELAGIHFVPIDHAPVNLEALSGTLYDLGGYMGLAAFLVRDGDPPLSRQLSSLDAAIASFRVLMLSGQRQIPMQLTRFQQAFFTDMHQTIEALQTQDATTPLTPQDLPLVLRHRFLGVTGKYLLEVFGKDDLWQRASQQQFLQELETVVPTDQITGTPSQLYQYTTLLKNGYERAAVYALIAIIIGVLFQFRSLVALALTLLPVIIGTTWLLGWMGFVGIPFNPANIVTLPLVAGIGVLNGIQILNRFAEEQEPSILAKSTGKAVLVSSLIAIAGFGSLMLASHQGIKSLGQVMSAGLAACMVASLMVLPALLRLLMHFGWRVKPARRHHGSQPVHAAAT